jgi:hypothetical protein
MKFQSYNKAQSLGIRAVKLPIKDFIKGRNRPLNVDSVACLLSEYADCRDWRMAYERATSRNEGLVT